MTKYKSPSKRPTGNKPGRPTNYRPEYCQMLIDHMKQGYTFSSFAGLVSTHEDTLIDWAKRHDEFRLARKAGLVLLERHYIDMGRAIATGQLRRVKSEKPILDKDGKGVVGPDGQILMEREYEQTQGNATAWIFLTKNILKWRNENHFVHSLDQPAGNDPNDDGLTPEERMRAITEMTRALKEMEDEERTIETTSRPA